MSDLYTDSNSGAFNPSHHPGYISFLAKCNTEICTNDDRWRHKLDDVPGASQPAITCSNLTIETVEQGVKYVQS